MFAASKEARGRPEGLLENERGGLGCCLLHKSAGVLGTFLALHSPGIQGQGLNWSAVPQSLCHPPHFHLQTLTYSGPEWIKASSRTPAARVFGSYSLYCIIYSAVQFRSG